MPPCSSPHQGKGKTGVSMNENSQRNGESSQYLGDPVVVNIDEINIDQVCNGISTKEPRAVRQGRGLVKVFRDKCMPESKRLMQVQNKASRRHQ